MARKTARLKVIKPIKPESKLLVEAGGGFAPPFFLTRVQVLLLGRLRRLVSYILEKGLIPLMGLIPVASIGP